METTRRRNTEAAVLGRRSHGQHFVTIETRTLDIGSQHVDERVGLGHRLDVAEIEVVDVGEVVEHSVELPRVALDFFGGNVEAREARDLRHVGGGETL